MQNIKKYLHVYVVILTILILIGNLIYHYAHSKTLFLDDLTPYHKSAKVNKVLIDLASKIVSTCYKDDDICRVQKVLDYITNIPYKINTFTAHKPLDTIRLNYGDCDDKSNLLISLLKSINYQSYLVIIPKHAYVITHLRDPSKILQNTKAFCIQDKKYYELESTAKNSKIGFMHKNTLQNIEAIYDPFINKKIDIKNVDYY